MPVYQQQNVGLSQAQLTKLRRALKNKSGVSLRLTHSHLHGNHPLGLTNRQVQKLAKNKTIHKGMDLRLSHAQLRGSGIASTLRGWAGDALAYGGHKLVDYGASRVRGDGFLRDLAGSAVSGLGNFIGNKIKGGKVRGRPRKSRRHTKSRGGRVGRPRKSRRKASRRSSRGNGIYLI